MTPDEFGAKIKAKYPDYADMDNTELSRRIVEKHPDYASQVDFGDATNDAPADTRMASDSGEALLTNLPTQGFKQDIVRGLPAAGGGMVGALSGAAMGAPFGPLGIIAGGILGAGIGGGAGEATRQAVAQTTAGAFPEQQYPMATGREVLGNVGMQGAVNAAGEGFGLGAGAAYRAIRPAFSRGGAIGMKVAANIPEKSGVYALDDLTRLGKAPTDEAVSQTYDAFHSASGTVGRKEAVARSGDPFDTVSRAVNSMKDAYTKLRAGTLTVQEAVEASQAGRIIRDMKSRGNEFAQEVAGTADDLKGSFDDFIERGIGPKTELRSIPVAQQITRETTPIASKIVPKSDVYETARTLIPERVNVPTSGSTGIADDLRGVVEIVKRAKGNGLAPKSIMTDAERALYDQFQTAVESSAQHNVPIETLLTSGEMTAPVAGFAEKTVLRPGEPIYAGANRMAFGGTIERASYKPGAEIMGDWPVHVPAQAGFPEWQAARQAAFENSVAADFGSALPRNVNGSPNVLRTWSAIGGGATTGAGLGAMMGGPAGAAVGGLVGAVGGGLSVSPMAYGAAIRMGGAATRAAGIVPNAIYRVGAKSAVGGAGSALADAYMRQPRTAP